MSRYDLTDFKWRAIEPLLPKSREACRASMIDACCNRALEALHHVRSRLWDDMAGA
jgi:transposase